MNRLPRILLAAVLAASGAVGAVAQDTMQGMDHSAHGAAPAAGDAVKAYQAANARMHAEMGMKYSGDPDIDFLRAMIPHHQGAIDMAKVVLQYGKDDKVKALARDIIAAQEKEIAEMQAWLKAKGAQ